jgi:hypothetical protein
VSAENPTETVRLEGWLDAVLDELATPEKRPFGGMDQAPASQAPASEAPPVEEAPVEEEAVEASSSAPPPKKRRRFFGL